MTTTLDISDFVYNTGTLTIAADDTTAVFSGTSLSANIKDGDYLFAGGSLAVIETVTDDTNVELFTEWAGSDVTAGTYVILKASMLRNNAVQIGYDTAAFLAFLDNTSVFYAVSGTDPDPSIGEEGQWALKTDALPWKAWLKTGGVWVLQATPVGEAGAAATIEVGTVTTGAAGSDVVVDNSGTSSAAVLDFTIPVGDTGPAAWLAPVPWTTTTAFVSGPPASVVTQGGETYVCLEPHTSGTFATDLAAGKWIKVAAKGTDGTGTGDLVAANNLSDLADAATARTNLGLGTAATTAASAYATAAQAVPAGGTTGQLLAKVDNTDNNTHWIDAPNTDIASVVHAATSKTTPADADEIPLVDSAASNVLKKLTWANLKAALAAWLVSAGWIREVLTANRTYYVDSVNGSDSNNGLANTSGGAFKTVTKAIAAATALDLSIYSITIQLTGNFSENAVMKSYVGVGPIIIVGDETTPSNCTITGQTGSTAVFLADTVIGRWDIRGVKITSSVGGQHGINATNNSVVGFQNVEFGSLNGGGHVAATDGAIVVATSSYKISGPAAYHAGAIHGGLMRMAFNTVTITNTPAFSTAFFNCSDLSSIRAQSMTFSGLATGLRYISELASAIYVGGAGATYLPGNSNGTPATGGQYA